MSKSKKILIIILCLAAGLSIFLTYKAFRNKPTILDDVNYNTIDKKTFGIFIEKDTYSSESDKYEEYNGTTWPTGYELNASNSMCFDNDGVSIPNPLSFNSGTITITTSNTAYCYLYFDKESAGMTGIELVASNPSNMSSSLVGGLYRYQGTYDVVDNNYICFGTDNESTCTGDTDHYMYRIIGVNSSGQIEVIKKEALNTGYKWYDDTLAYEGEKNDTVSLIRGNAQKNRVQLLWFTGNFSDSTLLSIVNGNAYLGDTNYIPNSTWSNKIASKTWKYGVASNSSYDGDVLYTAYEGWTDETDSEKISLQYMHDYLYAYGSTAPGNETTAKDAWIHLSHNDGNPPFAYEWTMSKSDPTYATFIKQTNNYSDLYSVRPVFYLESTVTIIGSGTINHPYIINN